MPMLSRRTARPLLHIVEGRAHASHDDHEPEIDSRGSSPLSDVPPEVDNEDFTREPDSGSSSEDDEHPTMSGFTRPEQPSTSSTVSTLSGNIHSSQPSANGQSKQRFVRASLKRKQQSPEEKDIAHQPDWMSSSQQSKRSKTGTKYGSSFKRPTLTPRSSDSKASKTSFQRPVQKESSAPVSSQPETRLVHNGFVRPKTTSSRRGTPANPDSFSGYNDLPSSPPLSSPLSSDLSEVEEVYLDGQDPADYLQCPLCEGSVSKAFKTVWEEEHCHGRRMNLKLQEKFCRAHKIEDARQAWKDRNYPTIKWEILPSRLARFKPRIDKMLDGKMRSGFKKEFEENVKQADSRTVMKAWTFGATDGPRAGYYGGKGAKIISDYSLKAFARKIPRLAGKNKAVATASVTGGVSGLVQAVVVPELALALIMDDLQVDESRARAVLDESTAIGNALHTEEEERPPARALTPPPTYGADEIY